MLVGIGLALCGGGIVALALESVVVSIALFAVGAYCMS
jgi:hypothetical protein